MCSLVGTLPIDLPLNLCPHADKTVTTADCPCCGGWPHLHMNLSVSFEGSYDFESHSLLSGQIWGVGGLSFKHVARQPTLTCFWFNFPQHYWIERTLSLIIHNPLILRCDSVWLIIFQVCQIKHLLMLTVIWIWVNSFEVTMLHTATLRFLSLQVYITIFSSIFLFFIVYHPRYKVQDMISSYLPKKGQSDVTDDVSRT